ncbi:MAG: enoyl-CoA hydratase-related protein [Bacteroidia bacterium]|nr:enoyl-CoA hydratase-related protein [Bacteroidia bacterium]MDW8334142.1 enoyl-CoA hydratase-related protein [Bacteroidia bacterium]
MANYSDYTFFEVEKRDRVAVLFLNRPEKKNLMTWSFWGYLREVVGLLEADDEVRAVVVAGKGECFSAGMDFKDFFVQFGALFQEHHADNREKFYKKILLMQEGFERIAQGEKPYIAAVHGYCIGGGLDLIAACDIRIGCENAVVSLREAKVAIVADMGSLQRLPGIIGQGRTRLMAFTGADYDAQTCFRFGLFDELCPTPERTLERAVELARQIAANPAGAVRGTKHMLNHAWSHGPEEGMKYVAAWNAAFLDSLDFRETVASFLEKRPPKYS